MAPDINLLPDERRRAEERELRSPRGSSAGQPLYTDPAGREPVRPGQAPTPTPPLPQPKVAPVQAPAPAAKAPPPAAPAQPRGVGAQPLLQRLRGLLGGSGSAAPDSVPPVSGVNLDVNLIPQEAPLHPRANLWPLVGAVLGAAVAVSAAFVGFGLATSQSRAAAQAARDEAAATAERLLGQQQTVEEMTRAVQQVRSVAGLLDGHVYWTRYFAWLESVTLPDVYYSGFMGDVAGTFTLSASARDYVTLAQQLVVLRADPRVLRVSVAEASRDSQGWVNFTMSLAVDPSVLTQGS